MTPKPKQSLTNEEISRLSIWENAKHAFVVICPKCHSFGCPFCKGNGYIFASETFKNMHDNLLEKFKCLLDSKDQSLAEKDLEIKKLKHLIESTQGKAMIDVAGDLFDKDEAITERDLVIDKYREALEGVEKSVKILRESNPRIKACIDDLAEIGLGFARASYVLRNTQPSGILSAMKSWYEALVFAEDELCKSGKRWGKHREKVQQALTNLEKYFPHTQKHEEGSK